MHTEEQMIFELKPPEYTSEEKSRILDYFLAIRKDYLQEFLRIHKLPITGTKEDYRDQLENALVEGLLQYKDLVNFVDRFIFGSKQHVYLYTGPEREATLWRDSKHVEGLMGSARVKKYFKARLPLILPAKLALSSIEYNERKLRVLCVERRIFWERRPDLDKADESKRGKPIQWRAFVYQVMRGAIIFEWDLMSNTALLHITQLPSGTMYEDIEDRFFNLVQGWLARSWFEKLDLKPAVKKLHELEASGSPEARSHGIRYITTGGRSIAAQSATAHNSLLGEPEIDMALDRVKSVSVGHRGNFYWLPSSVASAHGNTLDREVHTYIEGTERRINFSTPNDPEHIKYVLQRVRAHI